ncbi:MAG: M28 family peptidase [Candidatus Hodarchaeales archaeon]|jgi:hypothetical protein
MKYLKKTLPLLFLLIFIFPLASQLAQSISHIQNNERLEYLGLDNLVSNLAIELDDHEISDYKNYVEHLTNNIGPRPFGSDAIGETNQWINGIMYNDSRRKIMTYRIGLQNNCIGYLEGDVRSEYEQQRPAAILMAHYDTTEGSPGADSDASGVAVLLYLSKIISNLPYKLHFDVYFVFTTWSGHIEGIDIFPLGIPLGSYEVADFFEQTHTNILFVMNVNQLLYSKENILYYRYPTSSAAYYAQSIASMSHNYKSGLISIAIGKPEDTITNGDLPRQETVFVHRGIPVIVAISDRPFGYNPYYTSGADTLDAEGYNYTNPFELVHSMALAFVDWSIGFEYQDSFHYATFEMNINETIFVSSENSDNIINFYFTCVYDETCAIRISRSTVIGDDDKYANKIMQDANTTLVYNNTDSLNFWSSYEAGGSTYEITSLTDKIRIIVVIGLDTDFDLYVDRLTDIYFHIYFTKYDLNPPRVRGTRRADDTTTTYRYETSRTVVTFDTDTTSSYTEKGSAPAFTVAIVIVSLITSMMIFQFHRKKKDKK